MARLIVILLLLASCTHDKVVNHNQTDTIKYEECIIASWMYVRLTNWLALWKGGRVRFNATVR